MHFLTHLVNRYWLYCVIEENRVKVVGIFHEQQDIDDYALIDLR